MAPDNNWVQQERHQRDADRVVETIRSYTAEHGYAPTIMEIVGITGLGRSTVNRHLVRLIETGVLTKGRGHRTIRIAD